MTTITNPKTEHFTVVKAKLEDNFTQIPNQIFKIPVLSTLDKLVLMYLFSNSENYKLSNYRISVELHSDRKSTVKSINKLTKLNLINITDNKLTININSIINYKTIELLNLTKITQRKSLQVTEEILAPTQRNSPQMTEEIPSSTEEILANDRGNPTIPILDNTIKEVIQEENDNTKLKHCQNSDVKVEDLDLTKKNNLIRIELDNEVKNYNPIYISNDNVNYLNHYYIEFKLEHPNININISQFEKLLLIKLDSSYQGIYFENDLPDSITINNYIINDNPKLSDLLTTYNTVLSKKNEEYILNSLKRFNKLSN